MGVGVGEVKAAPLRCHQELGQIMSSGKIYWPYIASRTGFDPSDLETPRISRTARVLKISNFDTPRWNAQIEL